MFADRLYICIFNNNLGQPLALANIFCIFFVIFSPRMTVRTTHARMILVLRFSMNITRSDLPHPSVTVDLPQVSDHSLVRFQIPIHRPPPQILNVNRRAWKNFDTERFRVDLLKSELCNPGIYEGMSVDQGQELYDSTLSSLLDKHSPRRTAKRRYQPLTPWFDSECAASKRKSRVFERLYRRTRDPNDRIRWINQVRISHDLFKMKQNTYWKSKVKDSRGNSKKLWKTLNGVLGKDRKISTPSKDLTADDFLKAFTEKIEGVRQFTSSAPYPKFDQDKCSSSLLEFESVDAEYITRLIRTSTNKNCSLDPVPTWIYSNNTVLNWCRLYCS